MDPRQSDFLAELESEFDEKWVSYLDRPAPPGAATQSQPPREAPIGARGFFSATATSDGAVLIDATAAPQDPASPQRLNQQPYAEPYAERNQQQNAPPRASPPKKTTRVRLLGRREKERIDLIESVEGEKMKECTFKPKINKGRLPKGTFFERLEHWDRKKAKKLITKIQERHAAGSDAELEECTFQPNLVPGGGARPRWLRGYSDGEIEPPVEDRLMQQATERASRRAKLKARVKQETMAECTFEPNLKSSKKKKAAGRKTQSWSVRPKSASAANRLSLRPKTATAAEQRPIWNRLGELQRSKEERAWRTKSKLSSEECTFAPVINEKSAKMVAKLENEHVRCSDPAVRLSCNSGHGLRRLRRQVEKLRNEAAECTFRPKVNPVSKKIAKQMDKTHNTKGFFERQKVFDAITRQNMMALKEEKERFEDTTFTPDIGNADKILVRSSLRTRYETEDPEETAERLSLRDSTRKQAVQEVLEKEYYEQFAFKPKINPKSKKMAKKSSINELHKPTKYKKKQFLRTLAEEAKLKAECPFQPQISEMSRFARSSGYNEKCPIALIDDIDSYRAQKEEKLDEVRKSMAQMEMRECTFKPKVNRKRVPTKKSVSVAGLDKFLEKKKLEQHLKTEKKEREARAFKVAPQILKARKGGRQTVQQPFKLLSSSLKSMGSARRMAKAVEAETNALKECTFQPSLVSSRAKRELVQAILYDSVDDAIDTTSVCSENLRAGVELEP